MIGYVYLFISIIHKVNLKNFEFFFFVNQRIIFLKSIFVSQVVIGIEKMVFR